LDGLGIITYNSIIESFDLGSHNSSASSNLFSSIFTIFLFVMISFL
jgi:hypothetical protein